MDRSIFTCARSRARSDRSLGRGGGGIDLLEVADGVFFAAADEEEKWDQNERYPSFHEAKKATGGRWDCNPSFAAVGAAGGGGFVDDDLAKTWAEIAEAEPEPGGHVLDSGIFETSDVIQICMI